MKDPEKGEKPVGAAGGLTSVKCPRCAADNDPQLGICFNDQGAEFDAFGEVDRYIAGIQVQAPGRYLQ